ncbi:MAG: hypothetical protein M9930_03710 [Anaerolineae bacterium]|nr:hypothetical protein [Anaerolineae bacterium]
MKDALTALENTPLTTFLVVGGIVLIVLALAGGFSDKIKIPPERQRLTGIVGVVFLIIGVGLYLLAPETGDQITENPTQTPIGTATIVPSPTPTPPTAATAEPKTFVQTFDVAKSWPIGQYNDTVLRLENGVYVMEVAGAEQTAWSTADDRFADGIFSLEGALLEGDSAASYGIVWRSDTNADEFYAFQVDADGLVWIGRCLNACAERVMLVGSGWFESDAVRTGYNQTNVLRVEADGSAFTFFINGVEVGRSVDAARSEGTIGVIVETANGERTVARFDNFTVISADN